MFWLSNQRGLSDYVGAAPTTEMGYDARTDYLFEWVTDSGAPLGPVRGSAGQTPTNIAVYGNQSRAGMTYGVARSIDGRLAAPGAAGGRTVLLLGSTNGSSWKTLKQAKTDSSGAYSFSVAPTSMRYYATSFPGGGGYSGVASSSFSWKPKARFDSRVLTSAGRRNKSYTYSVAMSPRHAKGNRAVTLIFQRLESGKWNTKKTVKAKAANYRKSQSKYSAKVSLPKSGEYRVIAVHSDSGHAETTSSWRPFKLR